MKIGPFLSVIIVDQKAQDIQSRQSIGTLVKVVFILVSSISQSAIDVLYY